MSESHETGDAIRKRLKNFWFKRRVELAAKGIRKLPSAKQMSSDERRELDSWKIALSPSSTPLMTLFLLAREGKKDFSDRCALAALKGYLIGAGNRGVTMRALRAQAREEAESLEHSTEDEHDPYFRLILQAHARLNDRNRPFYTSVFVAAGGPAIVGAAATWEQFKDQHKDGGVWLWEAMIMYAGLHTYVEGQDEPQRLLQRPRMSTRCFEIPEKLTWRPERFKWKLKAAEGDAKKTRRKQGTADIRLDKTLYDTIRMGRVEAAALAYALYSMQGNSEVNPLDALLEFDFELHELQIDWVDALLRTAYVLTALTPLSLIGSDHRLSLWRELEGRSFAPPSDFCPEDIVKLQQHLDAPGSGRRPAKSVELKPEF